jgi:hypothetical protein
VLAALLGAVAVMLFAGGHARAAVGAATGSPVQAATPSLSVSLPSVPTVKVPTPTIPAPNAGAPPPNVGTSLPSVSASTPGVNVSVPGVAVSAPSVSVSTPGVSASSTGVSVSEPSVGVSSGSVGVSPPGVSVPTPKTPEAPTAKTPQAGDPTAPVTTDPSQPRAGGGAGASSSDPDPSSGSGSGSAATVADPASSAPTGAAGPKRAAGAAGRGRAGTRRGSASGAQRVPPSAGARSAAISELAQRAGVKKAAGTRATVRPSSDPLDAIGRHIPLPLPVPDWSKPIIVLLLLVAVALGLRARVASVRARRLEGQRTTLLRDLDAMQAALVPAVPAHLGGLAVSVAYRPADGPAAGGDFYDLFSPQTGKVAIILGDVAGHGRQALTQAALTRYTLRAYLQAGLEPRAALALAGRVLAYPTLEHFATVIVAVYDRNDGQLTYASAGHPSPILHGLPPREPLSIYASPPVGWGVPTGRRQTTLSLPAGAVVCFFSDGLIEARCNEELLGVERLDAILRTLGERPDATQLLERVRASATSTPDDMAACIFISDGAPTAAYMHTEEVEADARALESVNIRRFLQSCRVPAEEVTQVIARARAVAAKSGTALLRVELGQASATARVSHADRARTSASRQRARHAERVLPRAVTTS